jgi:monoamine oxidase
VIIVIGAGVAGLTAAWRLQQAGRQVRVLEAQDRAGGRLLTTPDGHDLGASWVWDSEVHVHRLLPELGLSTFTTPDSGVDLYDDGERMHRGRLPRSTVAERRIAGGMGALMRALVDRVSDLHLGVAVDRITVDDGLVVYAEGAMHRADHVIAAVPPAVLARTVEIPALAPERRDAWLATPTWMSDMAKVVATYPRPFWRESGLSGRAASRVGPLVEVHDLSLPDMAALFGFVPRQLATTGWRDRLAPQLSALFQLPPPTQLHVRAWWEDPWTATPPGERARMGHPRLRQPALGGRLHLVSTETSAVSPGHVDGAVERAEAVALALR